MFGWFLRFLPHSCVISHIARCVACKVAATFQDREAAWKRALQTETSLFVQHRGFERLVQDFGPVSGQKCHVGVKPSLVYAALQDCDKQSTAVHHRHALMKRLEKSRARILVTCLLKVTQGPSQPSSFCGQWPISFSCALNFVFASSCAHERTQCHLLCPGTTCAGAHAFRRLVFVLIQTDQTHSKIHTLTAHKVKRKVI